VDLDVTLRQDEVTALLARVAPLRIHLTDGDEDRRYVELEPPSRVIFATGEGIRIINQALEPKRLHRYSEVAQALTLGLSLPERFEPLDRFSSTVRSAQVSVTHDALILRLSLGLAMSRTRARPMDGPPSN
jgi:hypothetical protein